MIGNVIRVGTFNHQSASYAVRAFRILP